MKSPLAVTAVIGVSVPKFVRLPGGSSLALVALGLLCASVASGQSVAPKPDELTKESEVVELSPFVVTGEKDVGYQAASTLAGTRLNTDIKDIGAAVSAYTEEFLKDINVTKLEDILTYTTSTEGAGQNGNFSGVTGESSAEVRSDPSSVNRVRALARATRTRDFFVTDIPGDGFNFGTLTVSRGPNAILAGVGEAGGIIDSALRKATFKDEYRFVSRFSSYESHREELHINKVLIPQRLSVRIALLNDDQNFRQQPAYSLDRRFYAAMQYRFLEPPRGSFLGRGTFRANVETGNIEGVPPDPITPTFTVGNWFNAINPKWRYNGALQQLQKADGTVLTGTAANYANSGIAQGFPLYAQWALVFADPASSQPGVGLTTASLAGVQGFQGTIPGGVNGPGGALRGTGDPARSSQLPGFLRPHLSDPQIFNFYDNLLTGNFDRRSQTFRASDFRYEQLLMGGKAGFEAAYNYQTFTARRNFPMPGSGDDEGIFVDVNTVLSVRSAEFPNGIPNPNFGRPFLSTPDVFREQMNRTERESYQLTAFLKHDFTKSENRWAKLLGRHTLSGLLFKTDIDRTIRNYGSTWDTSGGLSPLVNNSTATPNSGPAPGLFGAQVNGWFYLGPSLANLNNVSEVRLQPISAAPPQLGESYTVQIWNNLGNGTRTWTTGQATPIAVLNRISDSRESLHSSAVSLQSYWLKNYITTVVGWREDVDETFSPLLPARLPNGNLDDSALDFQSSGVQGKRSWTKSVVGLLPYKFPGNTEIRAFWSESGNFTPGPRRRNIWNEELASPSAFTTEKGISISSFNGKFFLRVNRYETAVEGDTIGGVRNAYAYINTTINNMVAANLAGLNPVNYGYKVNPTDTTSPYANFEQVARAIYAALPSRMRIGSQYNFNPQLTGTGPTLAWNTSELITNLVSTSNTRSSGTEFEAIVNPTRGWRIAFSVAKNDAVKENVASEELEFARQWVENIRAADGGALIRGDRTPGTNPGLTFLSQYDSDHVSWLRVSAAQSGSSSAEIRKWRANLVTRYEFQSGLLRGLSIGGAVRWQDKVGIGYPDLDPLAGRYQPDISNPIYGPSNTQIDASIGYKRKLKFLGSPVLWTVGVNVRNLNAKDELIPIQANSDGSWATFRIPPERTWSISNSIAF